MLANDISDSTDWLSTPLSALAAVEAALRCQVCKDFYKTPMITSCSHTFCSLCIRRALSTDGKCPLCLAPEQELKLRSNWSIEEAAEAFVKARPEVLNQSEDLAPVTSSKKRSNDISRPCGMPPKRLRVSARLQNAYASIQAQKAYDAPGSEENHTPEHPDDISTCPVCQRDMEMWKVFSHLETCPGQDAIEKASGSHKDNIPTSNTFSQTQRTQEKSCERLPALNYSMLKDQALRKKLSELGITSFGPRQLLERRHREWSALWNANCDAVQPKRRSELLNDLSVWERAQGGRASMPSKSQQALAVKDKDFDTAAWTSKHNSSFKELIASAQKSRLEAASKAKEPQSASQEPLIAAPGSTDA